MSYQKSNIDYNKQFAQRQEFEPARAYLWAILLPDITIPLPEDYGSESMRWAIANATPTMSYDYNVKNFSSRVTEVSTPYFTIDSEKVTDGSTYWYSARHNDIGTLNITIDEDQYGTTLEYIQKWRRLLDNPNGTYNPPAFFKRDIIVWRMNIVKLDFQMLYYKGYFPTEFSEVQNSYENSEVLQYNVSFTGDSLVDQNKDAGDVKEMYESLTGRLLDTRYDKITDKTATLTEGDLLRTGTGLIRSML